MLKIKKILFEDDTELELENFKPKSNFDKPYQYYRQFKDFEDTILDHLEDDNIERYAEWSLDMIKEDDCECECDCDHNEDIENIDDSRVIREAFHRMIGANFNDIISLDLIKRFTKILYVSDKISIENYIKQKETELNI